VSVAAAAALAGEGSNRGATATGERQYAGRIVDDVAGNGPAVADGAECAGVVDGIRAGNGSAVADERERTLVVDCGLRAGDDAVVEDQIELAVILQGDSAGTVQFAAVVHGDCTVGDRAVDAQSGRKRCSDRANVRELKVLCAGQNVVGRRRSQ